MKILQLLLLYALELQRVPMIGKSALIYILMLQRYLFLSFPCFAVFFLEYPRKD